jgi:hypothetical protein
MYTLVMTENTTRPVVSKLGRASNACNWWWISSVGGYRVDQRLYIIYYKETYYLSVTQM